MFGKCEEPNSCSKEDQQKAKYGALLFMPLMIYFWVPQVTGQSSGFILQSMVEEKEKKIKETLKTMSLSI